MRFAIISADPSHCTRFRIHPDEGDATSFLSWISIFGGYHFNYDKIMKQLDVLQHFDVVMMSGHPGHLKHIVEIARYLKNTQTVSMFYPEGSAILMDNSINGFQPLIYEAWRACDILSAAEEDKLSYYRAFVTPETHVAFIHVPLTPDMSGGRYFVPRAQKHRQWGLVYGDNNPNHPLIAIAVLARLNMRVLAIEVDREGKLDAISALFPGLEAERRHKMAASAFLRALGASYLHVYPTEWIGTAREPISCAVTGTPCIGTYESHTQRRLYPKWMAKSPYDIDGMVEAAERLLSDDAEYERVAREAMEHAQFYNLENTKRRFIGAVEEAKKMKTKVIA